MRCYLTEGQFVTVQATHVCTLEGIRKIFISVCEKQAVRGPTRQTQAGHEVPGFACRRTIHRF